MACFSSLFFFFCATVVKTIDEKKTQQQKSKQITKNRHLKLKLRWSSKCMPKGELRFEDLISQLAFRNCPPLNNSSPLGWELSWKLNLKTSYRKCHILHVNVFILQHLLRNGQVYFRYKLIIKSDYLGDWSTKKDWGFDNLYGSHLQSEVIPFSQLKIQKPWWANWLVNR